MIATVTLNTSIDKAYQLDCPLERGTVMRVETCIDNAGGKGLNARSEEHTSELQSPQ